MTTTTIYDFDLSRFDAIADITVNVDKDGNWTATRIDSECGITCDDVHQFMTDHEERAFMREIESAIDEVEKNND